MADVIQKVISANDIVQGSCIFITSPVRGEYQSIDPVSTDPVDVDSVELKYTERF